MKKRLIDLDALLASSKEHRFIVARDEDPFTVVKRQGQKFLELVQSQPVVDAVEVVHGQWEDCSDKFDKGMDLRCLVCGGRADSFVCGSEDWYCLWKPNFCPHCGAKMDGGSDYDR